MNTKILIVGQAPPAVKQEIPYDTTLLYKILEWVDISKEQAQELFTFDALTDKFPGYHPSGGHVIPSVQMVMFHYDKHLKDEIAKHDKIIVLGSVARGYFATYHWNKQKPVLYLIHPSSRNYGRIYENKESITRQLKNFLAL